MQCDKRKIKDPATKLRFVELISGRKKAKGRIKALKRGDLNIKKEKKRQHLFSMMREGNEKQFFCRNKKMEEDIK